MMKKLLLSLFTLLAFQQCHDLDSEKPDFSAAQVVQDARNWYVKGLIQKGNSLTSKTGFTSIALWDKAKTYAGKTKDKHTVITPLVAYSKKQPQSSFTLISFHSKQKVQGFILQVIPDKRYLLKKFQTKDSLAFSGQIKIKLKNGKQMKTFQLKEGKPVPFIKAASSTFRTMDEGEDSPEDDPMVDRGTLDEVVVVAYQPSDDFNDFNYLYLDGSFFSSDWTDCIDDSWLYADANNDGQLDVIIPVPKSDEVVVGGPSKAVDNSREYLKCFASLNSATLSIYADQPIPGNSQSHDNQDVGHSFISIRQGSTVRTIGFYPAGWVAPVAKDSTTAVFGNDENHHYDVAISVDITGSDLAALINYINNAPSTYNINTYNCTTFVVGACAAFGLNLPQSNCQWPGGQGLCPGALGEDLRNFNATDRWIRHDNSAGTAAYNFGKCN